MTVRAAAIVPDGPAEPPVGSREEVGMRVSPEVALFVGGTALTVVLFAVFVPFMARVWRQDAADRAERAGRASGPGRDGGAP